MKCLTVGLAALAIAVVARGQTPVLAELFTSEGCSSCPPADRLLEKLDRTQPVEGAQIIALSEHVDYWNGLGWADPYSSADFTARQRRYAARLDPDGVYTPQLVIDGEASFVGGDEARALKEIAKAAKREKIAVRVSNVVVSGNRVTARVDAETPAGTALYVAVAEREAATNVTRGENAGRRLTHVSVVRSVVAATPGEVGVALPGGAETKGLRVVAFVQDKRTLRVLGAAMATN